MKALFLGITLIFTTAYLLAENGHDLWLRNKSAGSVNVVLKN